jgi:hypothetical protein
MGVPPSAKLQLRIDDYRITERNGIMPRKETRQPDVTPVQLSEIVS